MGSAKDQCERLNIRTKWPREDLDFTPWLACNLNLIGNVVGKKLELVEREKKVGSFWYLDILAKDTDTGKFVAIENQYGVSDTDHLGRLIAYSTWLDACIAIWIAEGYWHEHAEVLNRMNEWTRDGIEFYGLKIELVKETEDTDPVPRLLKVVYPGGCDIESTLQYKTQDPIVRKYSDFFEPLITKLRETDFAENSPEIIFDHTDRFYRSKTNQGIWYGVSLECKNEAWVTVHIRTENNKLTKYLYDELHKYRDQIESSVSECHDLDWHWLKHDNKRDKFSSINVRKEASINDPEEIHEETRAWMLDLLCRFKEVFDPRIAESLSDLQNTVGSWQDE